MTATGFNRGHAMQWDEIASCWRYADTGEQVLEDRSCVKCGEMPTPEGYDSCLGYIPGVSSACCGHGVEAPYQVPQGGEA